MRVLFPLIFLVIAPWGCINKRNGVVTHKKSIEHQQTIFVGTTPSNNSFEAMKLIENDLNIAFHQLPIDSSKYENEIRIYFDSNQGERYFKECYKNGDPGATLFNMRYDKRDDSFFIKVLSSIEWEIKSKPKNYMKFKNVPVLLDTVWKDDPGILDFGAYYYIEIKNAKKIQKIYSINPINKADISDTSNYISNIILSIQKKYNFLFGEDFKSIQEKQINR